MNEREFLGWDALGFVCSLLLTILKRALEMVAILRRIPAWSVDWTVPRVTAAVEEPTVAVSRLVSPVPMAGES